MKLPDTLLKNKKTRFYILSTYRMYISIM